MTIICSYGESSAWSKSVYCYVYDISLFVIRTQKKGQRFILYIHIYMAYFLSKENKNDEDMIDSSKAICLFSFFMNMA